MSTIENPYLTELEVAHLLRTTRRSVRGYADKGLIPRTKLRGTILYHRESLIAALKKLEKTGP